MVIRIKNIVVGVVLGCMAASAVGMETPNVAAQPANAPTWRKAAPAMLGGALVGACVYGVKLFGIYRKKRRLQEIQNNNAPGDVAIQDHVDAVNKQWKQHSKPIVGIAHLFPGVLLGGFASLFDGEMRSGALATAGLYAFVEAQAAYNYHQGKQSSSQDVSLITAFMGPK